MQHLDLAAAMRQGAPAVLTDPPWPPTAAFEWSPQHIADKIASVKGPLPYDRQVLQPAGEAMMHGLDEGLRKGFTSVLDRAHGMADQLAEAFGPGELETEWDAKLSADSALADAGKSLMSIPVDFAQANVAQLGSDLGISGNGALSQLLKQGLNYGSQFVFNVGSMDDALAGQKNIQNRQALQYTRR